jgi:hypothetical protein
MRLVLRGVLGGVAALAFATPALAQQVGLMNDGFTSAVTPVFQSGFVAGEMGASRFVPPAGTSQLMFVQLLFGPVVTGSDIVLHVYNDSAGTDTPGTQLFSRTYRVASTPPPLQQLDLPAAGPVLVSGPFRVAIEFTAGGLPSIARDADGIMADKNFVFAQGVGWKKSQDLGITGDWIIRAVVRVQPPDGGAGGTGGSAGAAGTGGTTGAGGTGGTTGAAGTGGTTGAAGTGGTAGSSGTGGSTGAAGTGGTTGAAGTSGTTGTGGTTGAAGTSGTTGTAGASGTTGSAGRGGTGGDGAMSCRVNSECPTGQYCLDKTSCTYDCRIDSDCGGNQRCTSIGQCEARPSGGGCSCRMNDTDGLSLMALLGAGLLLGRRRLWRRVRRRAD